MRMVLGLVILFFISPASAKDELRSFVTGLDHTLRSVQGPQARPCPSTPLGYSSARKTTYANQSVTVLSENDAQTLFADLQGRSDIPFDFSLAGCEQRAHEMARLMMLKGVTPLKVFVSVDEAESARLEVPNRRHPGQTIRWKYHVAPLIMVEKDGKIEPYVVDPSLQKAAVPLDVWRAQMIGHDKDMKVRTEIVDARQAYIASPMKFEFSDKSFNEYIRGSLDTFKGYQDDPNGEVRYEDDLIRAGAIDAP